MGRKRRTEDPGTDGSLSTPWPVRARKSYSKTKLAHLQMSRQKKAPTRSDALKVLWAKGRLDWKLHYGQYEVYQAFQHSPIDKFVFNCARRFGKSTLLCLIALEHAYRHPGAQIRYAAPTAKAVRTIIVPIIRQLTEDCPQYLRPRWRPLDGKFVFEHNGSELHIAGCNRGGADALRGASSHLCIIDEAGFVDDLDYVVGSVLMPQLLTTRGRLIMASTPPKVAGHPFRRYCEEAKQDNAYMHRTVFDNPMLTKADIARAIRESGGRESVTFLREYMAQFILEHDDRVVPEWDDEAEKDLIVDWSVDERPQYFDTYIVMDHGHRDLTAVLFAYWDFERAILCVEDEYIARGVTTDVICANIARKEKALWQKQASVQVADATPQLLHDMSIRHQRYFSPYKRVPKEGPVNMLRTQVTTGGVHVHPRCAVLIDHLRNATWDKQRRDFIRTKAHGHFDAVSALAMLLPSVRRHYNPFPNRKYDRTKELPPREYFTQKRSILPQW